MPPQSPSSMQSNSNLRSSICSFLLADSVFVLLISILPFHKQKFYHYWTLTYTHTLSGASIDAILLWCCTYEHLIVYIYTCVCILIDMPFICFQGSVACFSAAKYYQHIETTSKTIALFIFLLQKLLLLAAVCYDFLTRPTCLLIEADICSTRYLVFFSLIRT